MSLVKTSLLNSISVGVKILSGVVLNKLFAIYIGPTGYSTYGQFQNILTVANSCAGGVILPGVTKETAGNFEYKQKQYIIWSNALKITIIMALLTSGLIFTNIDRIREAFFPHESGLSPLYVLALLLPSIALNNLFLSIVNGKKEIYLYVYINIFGNIIFGIFGSFAIIYYGLNGVIYSMLFSPLLGLIFCLNKIRKIEWLKFECLLRPTDSNALKKIGLYALMGTASAVLVPLTTMYIRSYIEINYGMKSAGNWQGIQKISDLYLGVITSTLSIYFLPRIAEIKNIKEFILEIKKVYLLVIPLTTLSASFIYLFRNTLIEILFTNEFSGMSELFLWQMIGDVFKMGSWVMAYIMIGRGLVKSYIVTEIIFCGVSYGLNVLFLDQYGLIGSTIGYAVCYLAYWIVIFYVIKLQIQKLFIMKTY